ncbi:hypothetical protein [Pseudomonas paraeruginosa]|uniref:hypothetical protein n=1 Tax=Pseudomonas paraeruginosa TaxID=2994495 RepID=UPI00194FF929|nr:hypothetical protein [Pseudomonas paraeruginosa]
MDSDMETTQRKALYAWAWAIWIGFSTWPAYHSPMQGGAGFDWLLFALFVIAPKGFQGSQYALPKQFNRYYTAKEKRLALYWFLTLLLFAIHLGRGIIDITS